MVSSEPIFILHEIDETLTNASTSHSSSSQIIFSNFREMNKNTKLLNSTTYT